MGLQKPRRRQEMNIFLGQDPQLCPPRPIYLPSLYLVGFFNAKMYGSNVT